MYEAQGQQLQTAVQLQADSENYVIELRGRLAKLSERNAASEVIFVHYAMSSRS